jgi:alpha-L-rhamnosidase
MRDRFIFEALSLSLMESIFGSASWIASTIVGGPRTIPPVPFLRRAFRLVQPVRSATLTITALGLYEAEINGKKVGDQIFAPGWTDYKKRVQYQIHDVTALLRSGENVLGAVLGDGWYCGSLGFLSARQHYGLRPQLLARLAVVLRDGTRLEIGTDPAWKTTSGPILESDFFMGESYDARLELGNWSRPGFDDSTWRPVEAASAPEIIFNLSDSPPVRRLGELHPPAPRLLDDGRRRIYDLQQNFSGRVRLTIRAARDTTVTLRFAEILAPDGNLYTENLRSARSIDHYTCKGGGPETWEPRFTFHGFRYVEIAGLAQEDKAEITGVVLHSDIKPIGHFACSNPLLNQLQHNIVWGQKSNFLEVPTDCPQRDERLGWTGDAQVFVRTAAFNMDVRGFFHKWVQDIRDAQNETGRVPCVIPFVIAGDEDGGPAWSDAAVICPWTIYLCYGDRKILEDHYESMVRYLTFLGRKQSRGYIRSHPDAVKWGGYGDWLALDGGGKTDGITPKDLIGTAFYAYDADLLARIATLLGHTQDARRFRALHTRIVAAFQRRFVTRDGLIVSGTQTSYVLALHFDLLPERLRPAAAKVLAQDVEQRGFHLATGFVGTPYLLFVLEKHGYLDVAYRLLEQETFPSWLFPVKNGATTIWERWDGWTPEKGPQNKEMNSFNHYAYGAVGEWMTRTVAGLDLDPAQPGYRRIIFRPRPGGTLTWAEAELETPHGRTAIRWDKTKTGLKLDLTVPRATRAHLQPPAGYGKARDLAPGRHRFVLKKTGK